MIRFENVSKRFSSRKSTTDAMNHINLEIDQGEIYGIIGFSGAGKSTLVRCINLLEKPTEGSVYFQGERIQDMNQRQLRAYRQKVGMIFQQFNLLAQRNVIENICYPLEIAGVKKSQAVARAAELLELVGLQEKAKAYPEQLSGGQKQRVAIARALATKPEVLLCDEATSALDPITTRSILALLKEINEKLGVTIVVITHEMKVVEQICDRVAVMSQGTIEEEGTVRDVFLNPKSETARKLILPDHETEILEAHHMLRIAFDGQSAFEPVISEMTMACNIAVNILGARTENIGGKAYGQMLIELPKDHETANQMKQFLRDRKIHFEEGGGTHE